MKVLLACQKACNWLETTWFFLNNVREKHAIDGNPVTCHLKEEKFISLWIKAYVWKDTDLGC